MNSYLKQKIDLTYELALSLGLENATDIQKKVFKKSLINLCVASICDVKNSMALSLDSEIKELGKFKETL